MNCLQRLPGGRVDRSFGVAVCFLGLTLAAPALSAEPAAWEVADITARAEQGNPAAQLKLGIMYADGAGVPRKLTEAAKWYRLSAEQGNAYAQTFLGELYVEGAGVPQNFPEAARLYRLAADQGLAEAQALLGVAYADGVGVPRNPAEAATWWHRAAFQGNADAEYMLGVAYANGDGLAKDLVEAHAWLDLAVTNAVADAIKARLVIEKQMTPAQKAEAAKRGYAFLEERARRSQAVAQRN